MPLYPKKDEQQLAQFLWDSPNNGILFINKSVWNAQGHPIRLFGKFFGQHGLGDLYLEVFHCVVHSNTTEWNTLEQIFTNYTSHLDTYFNNLHAYEEMLEYMTTYVDTESD